MTNDLLPPNPAHEKPRLRPGLSLGRDESGQLFLWDPHRIGGPPVPISPVLVEAAQIMTGQRSLAEIQTAIAAKVGRIALDTLYQLVHAFDQALFLDSPNLRNYLTGPLRRPSCIGAYPEEPAGIHASVEQLFTAPGGPGLPGRSRSDRTLRAVLVPHMDFPRGNITYGHGFKELIEQTNASLFVVIATSHYSAARFSLTRMNYQTPLGIVETDQQYVESIIRHFGDARPLFADPFAHLPEHSIELEVVILQSLLAKIRPFRIVPLLCGSYQDAVQRNSAPNEQPDVQRMIRALRAAEAEAGEEVVYLISGDLAHIGPKFQDPQPVHEAQLRHSRTQDERLIDRLQAADAAGYYSVIAGEQDERRICGLPPTYLTLEVARPRSGELLHYQQYVHPQGHESVSFASAAFYA